jgi:hypothetical protein
VQTFIYFECLNVFVSSEVYVVCLSDKKTKKKRIGVEEWKELERKLNARV